MLPAATESPLWVWQEDNWAPQDDYGDRAWVEWARKVVGPKPLWFWEVRPPPNRLLEFRKEIHRQYVRENLF